MYGKLAQWLKFCAVNHDIMGSNPAETVYNFYFLFLFSRIIYLIIFVVVVVHICHVLYLFIITTMHAQLISYLKNIEDI